MSGLFQDDPRQNDPPAAEGPGLFGDTLPAPPAEGPGLFGAAAGEAAPAPAYRVLARKYRPTRFDDLMGQDAMVRILRNAFAMNRVAHAFMLTGVRGVGKTTTARIIARALNCIGPDGNGGPTADPCGVCPNCVAILADRHPDVTEMDAASRTGVDDVREIIEASRYRPIQARTKVFVIDEVHMLSRNAFNALLKTLEEPPPHVKFVFATTEIRKVPITVLSRCQRFDLRRVRVTELTKRFTSIAELEGVAIEPAAVAQIARSADGSVRDGLSLLDQAIAQADGTVTLAQVSDMLGLADRGTTWDLMDAVVAGQVREALRLTDRMYEQGADLGVILQDLMEIVYTLSRLQAVPALRTGYDLSETERTRGGALADRLSVPVLGRLWQMLLKGTGEVESAPDRRAAAEMVLIRLCHVADLPPPADLVRRLTGAAEGPSGARPALGAAATADGGAGSTGFSSPAGAPGGISAASAPALPQGGDAGWGLSAPPAAAFPSAAAPSATAPSATARSAAAPPAAAPSAAAHAGESGRGVARSSAPPLPHGQGEAFAGPAAVAFAGNTAAALAQPAPVRDAPAPGPEAGAPAPVRFGSFREVAAFVASERQAMLHGHLLHSVHLVRFAPPVIELRPQPEAPRDLAPKLATLLSAATGLRWTIALSTAAGEPTLAEQGNAADRARRASAEDHPLVRAIMEAFPGARIDAVHDSRADAYGLTPEPMPALNADDADIPAFAPPDADFSEDMEFDS